MLVIRILTVVFSEQMFGRLTVAREVLESQKSKNSEDLLQLCNSVACEVLNLGLLLKFTCLMRSLKIC